ncbi:hypothetical protein [Microbacterium sp. A94]|uniref:hypothetical protein n=1 Tax=Microbacterium sp. A94 TaxID=3450717 RepID=UPI003F42C2AB
MTSTRIRGKRLGLMLGAADGTPAWQDITTYTLANEDLDSPTFGDVATGAGQWMLSGTAIQSTAADSFWQYVWANAGSEVAFTLAPHGNETPSAAQPHFLGTVTIGRKPSLGGDVNSTGYTFEFEWEVVGEPTLDDGTGV